MKKLILIIFCFLPFLIRAQVTPFANDFKSIYIGDNGVGDYTRDLILVHEIYNGTAIDINYAVGTISAFRGSPYSYNRINIAEINSSSAYTSSAATLRSFDDVLTWKLKTCLYNGKKYLALDVPYSPAFHNFGYRFTGSTHSTGENMKSIVYQVNGQAVNQNLISDIQDYVPNMNESHFVNNFTVMGNVGIGTATPAEKLSINGKIRAHEIKVEMANWPDYVFEQDYRITRAGCLHQSE